MNRGTFSIVHKLEARALPVQNGLQRFWIRLGQNERRPKDWTAGNNNLSDVILPGHVNLRGQVFFDEDSAIMHVKPAKAHNISTIPNRPRMAELTRYIEDTKVVHGLEWLDIPITDKILTASTRRVAASLVDLAKVEFKALWGSMEQFDFTVDDGTNPFQYFPKLARTDAMAVGNFFAGFAQIRTSGLTPKQRLYGWRSIAQAWEGREQGLRESWTHRGYGTV